MRGFPDREAQLTIGATEVIRRPFRSVFLSSRTTRPVLPAFASWARQRTMRLGKSTA